MVAPLSIMQFYCFTLWLVSFMESRAKSKQGIEVQSSHIAHQKLCLTVRLRIFQQPYDSGIRMTLHDAIITQFQKSYDPKYHILKKITFLSVCRVSWTAKACSNSPSTLHSSRSSQRTGPNANPHSTDTPESFSHSERGSQN